MHIISKTSIHQLLACNFLLSVKEYICYRIGKWLAFNIKLMKFFIWSNLILTSGGICIFMFLIFLSSSESKTYSWVLRYMVTYIFDNIPWTTIILTRKYDRLVEKVSGKVLKNFCGIIKVLGTSSRPRNEKLGITKYKKIAVTI